MSTFLEVTDAENTRLELIIENWTTPGYIDDAAGRMLAKGLLPHLIILKGMTTMNVVAETVPEDFVEDEYVLDFPTLDETNVTPDQLGYTNPVFGGTVTSEISVGEEDDVVTSNNNGSNGSVDNTETGSAELDPNEMHNTVGYSGVI